MRKLPQSGTRGRPWSAARRFHGWLATWLQGRRRARQNVLLPAPVLVPALSSLATWEWPYANPARWDAYNSLDGGLTFQFDDSAAGDARQYAPDGGQHLMFIVGVDASGKEITERSNAVRPDDAIILSVAGLKLWVRVESLVGLADDTAVASWTDESGNARHLVQATAANRPVYKASGEFAPAVYFDGLNDVLATAGNVLNTDQHTFFLVARPMATSSNDALGTGSTGNGDVLVMVAYNNHQRGHIWRSGNPNTTDGAASLHTGAFAIFEQEVNATQLIQRLTGVTDAVKTLAGTPAGVSKPVYLGSRNSSWFFKGYVRALIVYEGNPSGAEMAAIRSYLISSHAVPTPYPPPPTPGAPTDLGGDDVGGEAYLWWDMGSAAYATGVKVERKPAASPDTSFAEVGDVGPDDGEFYDLGVSSGTFTYRVRAYNASGYSPYSNTATVMIA